MYHTLQTLTVHVLSKRGAGVCVKKQNNELDIGEKGENGVSRGGVNIKDPVPLYITDWEWVGVKCDFDTIQSCDISSVNPHFFVVYDEEIKRELKRIHVHGCR